MENPTGKGVSTRVSGARLRLSKAREDLAAQTALIEANRAERAEKLNCLGRLRLHFPHALGDLDDPQWKLVWEDFLTDLADYSADEVAGMCAAWRTSGERFFPTPGQLMGKRAGIEPMRKLRDCASRVVEAEDDLKLVEERDRQQLPGIPGELNLRRAETGLRIVPKIGLDISPERLERLKKAAIDQLDASREATPSTEAVAKVAALAVDGQ